MRLSFGFMVNLQIVRACVSELLFNILNINIMRHYYRSYGVTDTVGLLLLSGNSFFFLAHDCQFFRFLVAPSQFGQKVVH